MAQTIQPQGADAGLLEGPEQEAEASASVQQLQKLQQNGKDIAEKKQEEGGKKVQEEMNIDRDKQKKTCNGKGDTPRP